jgi:hypothetical protein
MDSKKIKVIIGTALVLAFGGGCSGNSDLPRGLPEGDSVAVKCEFVGDYAYNYTKIFTSDSISINEKLATIREDLADYENILEDKAELQLSRVPEMYLHKLKKEYLGEMEKAQSNSTKFDNALKEFQLKSEEERNHAYMSQKKKAERRCERYSS